MDKCNRCTKDSVGQIFKEKLCCSCFTTVIDKRIRKFARLNKLFSRNDKLLLMGDLVNHVVRGIIGDMPVQIEVGQASRHVENVSEYEGKFNKIVIPWTMDDENLLFLNKFFHELF